MGNGKQFMELAISLAKMARPFPNPCVGAVIVKDERIIGKGYHKAAGMPHAEIEAIEDAKRGGFVVNGSTLYVTLEPCVHTNKKTPPCVPAIIKSGIKTVVCAMKDPNPNVDGKGIEMLKRAGLDVSVGLCENEAQKINEAYVKYITFGLPFVTMKVAMSLDGKIATRTGDSKWISGEASRRLARTMRDQHAGVMVGIGTVLKDNPRLTCRFKSAHDPIRIIIDSKLRIPIDANVLKGASKMVIIGCGKDFDKSKKNLLESAGAKVFSCPRKDGEVDLEKFMKLISKEGVTSILLEGGSALDGAMVDAGLVDRFCFFIAPKIIGGKDAKTPIAGIGAEMITNAMGLGDIKVEKIGVDVLVTADVARHHAARL